MKIRREVLVPLAGVEVSQRGSANLPFDDDFTEATAKAIFGRHRSNRRSKVIERIWADIPNSEKGKYRRIVREAIERFRRNRKPRR